MRYNFEVQLNIFAGGTGPDRGAADEHHGARGRGVKVPQGRYHPYSSSFHLPCNKYMMHNVTFSHLELEYEFRNMNWNVFDKKACLLSLPQNKFMNFFRVPTKLC